MRAGRLLADTTPLRRHPDYRRLWGGITVSTLGSQMTLVAVPVQVYAITGSSLAVGLVGAFGLVGLVGLGLYGGAVADTVDRRKLSLAATSGAALTSAALVAQAVLRLDSLPLLYGLVLVQAGFFALDNPARSAMIPRLLPRELLPAGNALQQIGMSVGLAGGPLLAGVVIGAAGLRSAYLVDLVSFAAALWAVWRLPPMLPDRAEHEQARRAGPAMVLEGLAFLRTRRNLLMTFLVDINAMVFGMPRALFPALAGAFYGGGPRTVGLLYAAPALGALAGAVLSGPLGRVQRQGLAVLVSVTGWGLCITGFGLSRQLWLGVLLLAGAGLADMVSAVFRSTILQAATPDAMRGRLSGVFIVVVAGGPRLGDVESGGMAAAVSPGFSVVSGGLACVAGVVLLAALVPSFGRYDARDPQP